MGKITVKNALPGNEDGSFPVGIMEQNEVHPDGELYIADDEEHSVEETGAVRQAITDGRLVEVGGKKSSDDDDASSASTKTTKK